MASKFLGRILLRHGRTTELFIPYGTAGFREKSHLLEHIMYRMGIIASLRSKLKRAVIGIIITASHNPEEDNGIKLVDPHGEMLEYEWEVLSTKFVNLPDGELGGELERIIQKFNINLNESSKVFLGRDTRESSPALAQAAIDGIELLDNSEVTDFGLTSTPQLHFFVNCENTKNAYGMPSFEGYYDKLSSAFKLLIDVESSKENYVPTLKVDGANGVGALAIKEFVKRIPPSTLKIQLHNDGSGRLNYKCGADYVKIEQKAPEGLPIEIGTRYVSLDGDADRIVYYYFDEQKNFRLLDGDKLATLIAEHLGDLVRRTGLDLSLGLVQTAYANGSSTNYISETLGIQISCVPTGIKNLHPEAQKYDIGVYFEANGHGTVTFSGNAVEAVRESAKGGSKEGIELSHFLNLINSTNGDAISDLLTIEAILHSKGIGIAEWDSKYQDLPNKQMKVKIEDRGLMKTVDAERRVLEPLGVQARIDAVVAKVPEGRAFARPSGTEDVVRIYAEAATQAHANSLCSQVASIIYDHCKGVGSKPM